MFIYSAHTLLPVTSPPIRDGAVAVDAGRIVSVGPRSAVLGEFAGPTEIRELGAAIVMPGLVNAHTHVELSWLRDVSFPTANYSTWLRELLARRRSEDLTRAREAAERAVETIVARGTVAIGDVSNDGWVVPLLARSGLFGRAFIELLGFRGDQAEALVHRAVALLEDLAKEPDVQGAGDRIRVELTPHAPHTTSATLLRALAGRSAAAGHPISIHVAESEEEVALLQDGSGPFPGLFRERDFWDDSWEPPGQTPVTYLDRLGALSPRTLAIHCVRVSRSDRATLQTRGVTVVTCPRSNRRLGVGRAPIPKLLGEGIPVALGTDSLASTSDLDMFAEMAALRAEHPTLKPPAILRMATLSGARALGLEDRLGSVEAGKLAELIVVPLESIDGDPWERICSIPADVHRLADAPWEAST